MVEKIVAEDEALMERYLNGEEIPVADLRAALRKATIDYKLIPVLIGTSLRNKGVQLVLDAVVYYLPSPMDVPAIKGVDPQDEEIKIRKTS